MDILSKEELRRIPYSELKKYSRKQGIREVNMKAEKLISAILSARITDETLDSFTTCDESLDTSLLQSQVPHEVSDIGNISCRRKSRRVTRAMFHVEKTPDVSQVPSEVSDVVNMSSGRKSRRLTTIHLRGSTSEENKSWSEDSEIELKTPVLERSQTFSLDKPVIFTDKTYHISANLPADTPAKTSRKSILRHGNKSQSSKNSVELKAHGNKVNFVTPDRTLLRKSNSTPVVALRSVKDRPKTPVAEKSFKRKRVPSPFPQKSPKIIRMINGQADPQLLNGTVQESSLFAVGTKSDKGLQTGTPMAKSVEHKPFATATRIHSARKELTTLLSANKNSTLEMNKIQTPNFKEIHEKAFKKMENLEEYQERIQNRMAILTRSQKRARNDISSAQLQHSSTKRSVDKNRHSSKKALEEEKLKSTSLKPSRIPQPFRGIPFIPVVKSIRKINTNFASQTQTQSFLHSTSKMTVTNENVNPKRCQRSLFNLGSANTVFRFDGGKTAEDISSSVDENKRRFRKKFDLKASLAKKLTYKPHKGVLRPLADSNANQSQISSSNLDPIKKKREQSREVLKGVRKNRRFELQMSRRGLA